MKTQDILMDRAFDSVCVSIADKEWSEQIYNRLVSNYPQYKTYINQLVSLYGSIFKNNPDFCAGRRDYMLTHKDRMRMRF
jgi:hypothetical protein